MPTGRQAAGGHSVSMLILALRAYFQTDAPDNHAGNRSSGGTRGTGRRFLDMVLHMTDRTEGQASQPPLLGLGSIAPGAAPNMARSAAKSRPSAREGKMSHGARRAHRGNAIPPCPASDASIAGRVLIGCVAERREPRVAGSGSKSRRRPISPSIGSAQFPGGSSY